MKNTSSPSASHLHRQMAEAIFQKGLAYRDFTLRARRRPRSSDAGADGRMALQSRHAGAFPRAKRSPRRRRRAFRLALPRAARCRAANSLRRCGLRRAGEVGGRHRRFRLAAQRRHADLPSGIVRRRRRPAHQPHYSRPGSSLEHLQAPADFRGRRGRCRRSSRICLCWLPPTEPSFPSAATDRW